MPETKDLRMVYTFGSVRYDFTVRTYLMGVLNVTPDSFSDGGKFVTTESAVKRGMQMVEEGADFIDVGGESTRPGSEPVPVTEEIRRIVPVIEQLGKMTPIPISVDTYKSEVAKAAIEAGALIVNDISAMTFDPEMLPLVAREKVSAVLMHMKGTPKTMQQNPEYDHVVREVGEYLQGRAEQCRVAGIEQVLIDPGIGFGKNLQHNLALIKHLSVFRSYGFPLLVGPSRKSFLGMLLDLPVDQRLEGTAAAVTACVLHGASVVRVHDVRAMKRVLTVADALYHSA